MTDSARDESRGNQMMNELYNFKTNCAACGVNPRIDGKYCEGCEVALRD